MCHFDQGNMDLVPSTFLACCQAPSRSRTKLRQKEPLQIKHHHYHGFTVLNAGSTQSIFIVNIIIIIIIVISRPLPVFCFSVLLVADRAYWRTWSNLRLLVCQYSWDSIVENSFLRRTLKATVIVSFVSSGEIPSVFIPAWLHHLFPVTRANQLRSHTHQRRSIFWDIVILCGHSQQTACKANPGFHLPVAMF